MSTLPYLDESHWPTSKEPEEIVVNPSYDKQIQDHLTEELMIALEHKDTKGLRSALIELIRAIQEEE